MYHRRLALRVSFAFNEVYEYYILFSEIAIQIQFRATRIPTDHNLLSTHYVCR